MARAAAGQHRPDRGPADHGQGGPDGVGGELDQVGPSSLAQQSVHPGDRGQPQHAQRPQRPRQCSRPPSRPRLPGGRGHRHGLRRAQPSLGIATSFNAVRSPASMAGLRLGSVTDGERPQCRALQPPGKPTAVILTVPHDATRTHRSALAGRCPDVTCKDSTGQHTVDDPLLSCNRLPCQERLTMPNLLSLPPVLARWSPIPAKLDQRTAASQFSGASISSEVLEDSRVTSKHPAAAGGDFFDQPSAATGIVCVV